MISSQRLLVDSLCWLFCLLFWLASSLSLAREKRGPDENNKIKKHYEGSSRSPRFLVLRRTCKISRTRI